MNYTMKELRQIYTDEVIDECKAFSAVARTSSTHNIFHNGKAYEAFCDCLECIENESLDTIDDLDDYVAAFYGDDNYTFRVCAALVEYADGDYSSVEDMFDVLCGSVKDPY